MNYVVYFNFEGFFSVLKADVTVHVAAFSLATASEGFKGQLLITTDAGVEGGTVHAIQIVLLDKAEDSNKALAVASRGYDVVRDFLKSEFGVKVNLGTLSTAGLHESIRFWGQVIRYDVAKLSELLAKANKKELG